MMLHATWNGLVQFNRGGVGNAQQAFGKALNGYRTGQQAIDYGALVQPAGLALFARGSMGLELRE